MKFWDTHFWLAAKKCAEKLKITLIKFWHTVFLLAARKRELTVTSDNCHCNSSIALPNEIKVRAHCGDIDRINQNPYSVKVSDYVQWISLHDGEKKSFQH